MAQENDNVLNEEVLEKDEYSFEEELYAAIAMLGFWEDGQATATPGGVLFQQSGISAVEEFVVTGVAALDIRDGEEQPVEFMSIDLVLAKNGDKSKEALIKEKLYDVNTGLKEGMFFMDDNGNLCFEANFPVIRGEVETSLRLFIAQYIDIMNYLDGVYPYLLRVIAHPEVADFVEYIATMTAGMDEE